MKYNFINNGGELRLADRGSILFREEAMGYLTLREALASRQLDAFVREQQDNGAELVAGSELERGLALLVTRRRILVAKHGTAIKQRDVPVGTA